MKFILLSVVAFLHFSFSTSVYSSSLDICLYDDDADGDGYGWENGQSCRMPSDNNEIPFCLSSSSDTDGDGYGWENGMSCMITNDGDFLVGDAALEAINRDILEGVLDDDLENNGYSKMISEMGGIMEYEKWRKESSVTDRKTLFQEYGIDYIDLTNPEDIQQYKGVLLGKGSSIPSELNGTKYCDDKQLPSRYRGKTFWTGKGDIYVDSYGRPQEARVETVLGYFSSGLEWFGRVSGGSYYSGCTSKVGKLGYNSSNNWYDKDQGGHIIGRQFGGIATRLNLVPQAAGINNIQAWALEDRVNACMKSRRSLVTWTQKVFYPRSNQVQVRPDSFSVIIWVSTPTLPANPRPWSVALASIFTLPKPIYLRFSNDHGWSSGSGYNANVNTSKNRLVAAGNAVTLACATALFP